jgi:heat shock protein HtpX
MKSFKRIGLFLLTNILIVATISIVTSVLGLQPYLTAQGINYGSLMIFCLIWGFGGAFISLAISRFMAKKMMGVKLIDPSERDPQLQWLVQTTHRLSQAAGISKMPEVGFYEADELNAFATGPTQNRSLVAVSTGLLNRMNRDEVEGVLAHEVAHIANGDMVTMTLIQGVVNAFVMFFARIIAWSLSQFVDEEKRGIVNFVTVIVFDILLSFLGMMVVAMYSRAREFRADAGGAKLGGRQKMVAALRSLQKNFEIQNPAEPAMATLKISSGSRGGLMALLSTHPSLDERIRRLEMNV